MLGNVCADGSIPACMIIYPRKRIHSNIVDEFPEEYDFVVAKSEKGYITYETLYEFMCNSFDEWLTSHNVKRPVLVFTDWHETRNSYHLASKLNEQKIILYGILPNTTHLMQPSDVSVFGPLKKGWTRTAKDYEFQHPDSMIRQENFAKIFLPVYYKYVTGDNIRAGFEKCGLYPLNEERPDYSKIGPAAAQRQVESIFEGIGQG